MSATVKVVGHAFIVVILTFMTQVGGIAWLAAGFMRRRILGFFLIYALLSGASLWIAPHFGREPLPCLSDSAVRMRSVVFCALNRQYVVPELKDVLQSLGAEMNRTYPGTITQILDAGFPFFDGFPLLPHLSHDDGEKVDLAFYYRDASGYLPGATRSPIGYFSFENGPTSCPKAWPTLRWDLAWLQHLWRDYRLDDERLRTLLAYLVKDRRVGKVFLEPHLQKTLGVANSKIRFQGCRAARHDDHIHIQLH